MSDTELARRIGSEVERIPLLDSHEHIRPEEERLDQDIDLFYFMAHYSSSDLVSAGMRPEVLEDLRGARLSPEEKWAHFAPWWRHARSTGYGMALEIAARDLFEVDGISDGTWQELSRRIAQSNRKGWIAHVLKERARIEVAVVDVATTDVDRDLFLPVMRFDAFLVLHTRQEVEQIGQATGVAIRSLSDVLRALDLLFERHLRAGMVAVKIGVAYDRSLHFEDPPRRDAERALSALLVEGQSALSDAEARPLQDYLAHQVILRAVDCGLPIQIHTGIQEGNGNLLHNSHPAHLNNILLRYPEGRFVLFHAGYPFSHEAATLTKNFRNCHVDMCWLYIISPYMARRTLHELIEMVPANKILAFGGDYAFVEGAYAHSRMARAAVTRVLSEKVAEGYLNEDQAAAMAWRILRQNGRELFGLSTAGEPLR